MKRSIKKSLYKIFVSFFIIFYSFVPQVIAMDEVLDTLQADYAAPREEVNEEVPPEEEIIIEETEEVEETTLEEPKGGKPSLPSMSLLSVPLATTTEGETINSACIEDAYGDKLNCTANDISIAQVTGIEIKDDGCKSPTDTVTFTAHWNVQSTAVSRYDIGLYFPTEGQDNARFGMCSVSTLPTAPTDYWFDFDGDACGDASSSRILEREITLTVSCLDKDSDNTLDLPYCTSWNQNDKVVCTDPTDAIPEAPSKCNCQDGFEIPITVPYAADIEVVKNIVPSTDTGTFNLLIDGVEEATNVSDEGTTGKVEVGAGTSEKSGATHSISETAYGDTDISLYNTSISCIDNNTGGLVTATPLLDPLTWSIDVDKDDDIKCTITNTLNTANLTVIKNIVNDNGGSKTVNDFGITLEDTLVTFGQPVTVGDTATYTSNKIPLLVGQPYTLTELSNVSGYTSGTWDCGTVDSQIPTNTVITPSDSSDIFCTITNDDQPGKLIVKKIISGSEAPYDMFSFTVNDGNSIQFESDGQNDITVDAGTYTVVEDIVTGYTSTYDNCTRVEVSNGETETCTITNTRDRGTLVIQKIVDFGKVTDWYFSLNGAPAVQADEEGYVRFENIPTASDYKITESGPTNIFSLTSISGDNCTPDIGNLSATATVIKGSTTTCVFTNLVNRGSITVIKDAIPNDQQVFGFFFTGKDISESFSLDDDGDDSDGYFNQKTYSNLLPGSYSITETPLGNWNLTSLQCTTNIPGKAVGPFLGTNIASISLDAGESVECTYTNTKYASISGQKWHDLDANGVKDGEEEYISGWEIELRSSLKEPTDLIVSQLITNASEGYTFGNLLPGDYYICEVGKAGYYQSYPDTIYEYDGMDCHRVTLTAGQDITGKDFGNYTSGYVSGTKWEDMNGNGKQDLDDKGLSNWLIFVDEDGDEEWDSEELNTFTDINGYYSIQLEPGEYSICEEIPTDWRQSYPLVGNCHTVVITSGSTPSNYDFGNFKMVNIRACKKDTNDTTIEGWGMNLEYVGLPLGEGSETGRNGCVEFRVAPGTYRITEETRTGWTPQGSTTHDFVITSGMTTQSHTFVNFKDVEIEVCKEDTEGFPVGNWGVNLEYDDATDMQRTDSLGCYTWTVKEPGTYYASEEGRTDWTPQGDTTHTFNITSGLEKQSHTFVNFKNVEVEICKEDTEGDPVKDWKVYLNDNESLTGENGCTIYTVKEPGKYTATEETKEGWTPQGSTTHDFVITSGMSTQSHTFVNFENSTVRWCKEDTEGNLIPGWILGISGETSDDKFAGSGPSETGCEEMTIKFPGTYTVYEEMQPGWTAQGPTSYTFTAESGDKDREYTFVNFENVDIEVCKEDTEGDPIPGWEVTLGMGEWRDTQETNELGCYTWTVTEPGTYTASEETPTGWTPQGSTTHDFVITSGLPLQSYTFVNFENANIQLCKEDTNGDPVEGWSMLVGFPSGFGGAQNYTGIDGCANFKVTEPGTYTIMEELIEEGWTATGETSLEVEIESGESFTHTFTNFKNVDIEVCKEDTEGDPIPGWDVTLAMGEWNDTQKTDELGCYTWEVTKPGTYTATEETQTGWTPQGSTTHDFVITSGMSTQSHTFVNFKNVNIQVCKEDTEGDAVQGWEVSLAKNIQKTGVDGCYTWMVSGPGTYIAAEEIRDDWTPQGLTTYDFIITSGLPLQSHTFVNFEHGDLSVWKYEDTDKVLGRSTEEEYIGDPTFTFRVYEETSEGWVFKGEEDTDTNGEAYFENIFDKKGQYYVCEVTKDGWQEMRSLYNPSNNMSEATDEYPVCEGITVSESGYLAAIEFGNIQLYDIHGYKWEDINGNGERDCEYDYGDLPPEDIIKPEGEGFECEPLLGEWPIHLYKWNGEGFDIEPFKTMNTDDTEGEHYGWYWFEDLLPGKYMVCEEFNSGWQQTYPLNIDTNNCHIVNLPDTNPMLFSILPNYTDPAPTYNFGNYKLSKLIVEKDVLGRDHMGEGIYSLDQFEISLSDYEGSKYISDTQSDPLVATFEGLGPQEYELSEKPVLGYQFMGCFPKGYDPERYYSERVDKENIGDPLNPLIKLESGQELTYVCYNQAIKPELLITKSNDKNLTGIYAGDFVTYTILVEAPEDPENGGSYVLKDVKVVDILPEGFKYVEGSLLGATALSPLYESGKPTVLGLGDMTEGDTRVISYKVKVSLLKDPGIYDDIAYTYGDSLIEGDSAILGVSSTNSETNFVGTQVKIIEDPGIEEGEVLGTAIELPATGAETYITLGALISMILGFILLIFKPKKYIKAVLITGVLLLGIFTIFKPVPTYASPSTLVEVRIEQPETPTNKSSFNIGYVVSTIPLEKTVTVQCQKSLDAVNFLPYNGTYTTKNGNCIVDESVITGTGSYYFRVAVTPEGESETLSKVVKVIVELGKPLPVTQYSKTEGTCTYTLTFNTADDGKTSKVQIFRSSTQPFTANASTLIDTLTVAPNTLVTYTDDDALDCSKEYYYALRSMDSYNNVSSIVTDNIVTVVPGTTTTTVTVNGTTETGQIAGEETTTEQDGTGGNGEEIVDENGEVAGEETTTDEEQDTESKDEESKSFWNEYKYVILFLGVVLLSTVGYIYVKRSKK